MRSILFFVLAAAAASAQAQSWHLGEFQGTLTEEAATVHWSVSCKRGQKCAIVARETGAPGAQSTSRATAVPVGVEPAVANNTLDTARRAVAAKPDWYKDPQLGATLAAVRDVLESRVKFGECLQLDSFQLCTLSNDPRGTRSLMLLYATMQPSCAGDTQPFCNYALQPLSRVR